MIIYGTRMYGHVDAIDGLGEVKTKFIHIFWIPLIPIGTFFVLGEDEDGYRGVDLPFSFKGAICTWIRTFAFWSGLLTFISLSMSCLGVATLASAGAFEPAALLSVAGSCCWLPITLVLWFGTGWLFGTASISRRAQIFDALGMEPIQE